MKLSKRLAFSLLGCIIAVLVAATVIEKMYGTPFVVQKIYGSWWFVALWAMFAIAALCYMVKQKLQRRRGVFAMHLAFVLILVGALVTYIHGKQGVVHLRENESAYSFAERDGGAEIQLPFSISLDDFEVVYYPGTPSPMDYVSRVTVADDNGERVSGEVSMNSIFSYRNYRFYQSGYDEDGLGATLSVSYDPAGIAVTYTGYGLLLVSIIAFFFLPDTKFKKLLRKTRMRKAAVIAVLLLSGQAAFAAGAPDRLPKALPREVAEKFGDMYVLYNDRICPLQTLAKDFTTKLYGKPSYRGMTPEQVFTGWMFFYSDWKAEPMIKTKGGGVRSLLGIDGRYAALDDFIDGYNQYKLDDAVYRIRHGEDASGAKGVEEADEKYNIIRFLYSGKMFRIFPHGNADGTVEWFSQGDDLPADIDDRKWVFIKKTQDYIHEMVVRHDYEGLAVTLGKIKEYQRNEAEGVLPSDGRFRAEKLYNRFTYTRVLAMGCSAVGIVAFIFWCVSMALGRRVGRKVYVPLNVLLVLVWAYLTANIALRWIVGGHIPLSNGYETMQFMAWCSLIVAFVLRRRSMFLPFGFLLCGLTLMVSMFGESSPRITQLVPVLSSPLLSLHVVVIMIAYSLFAFMMFNGVAALIIGGYRRQGWKQQVERLQTMSRILLYPALFCLVAGIFVGAVWANVSWGRYWGWDPKEVWALITMLVYSLAVHTGSLPVFRRPMFFHVFCIVAFLTVLITYFGVNFVLGGMHSYA
ncbi:cytochrome c biogenesis protein CcsA [Alistipes sp. OttesenSCG-928-B03]|nr:cytochrome c biogenesis protein CcsA [Alistipes sp. OttesenSCG-928-B03]